MSWESAAESLVGEKLEKAWFWHRARLPSEMFLALCEQDVQAETPMLCQAATYGPYLQTPDRVLSPSDQQVNQTADSYLDPEIEKNKLFTTGTDFLKSAGDQGGGGVCVRVCVFVCYRESVLLRVSSV